MENQNEESNVLGRHYTTSQLIKSALPTMIMAVVVSTYCIVDGVFVSKFGGTTAFAAINFVSPIFLILASLGYMVGTGGTALISKTMGEGKKEEAKQIFSMLTTFLIIAAVILTVIGEIVMDDLLAAIGAEGEMLDLCMVYARTLLPFLVCWLLQMYFQSVMVVAGKGKLGLAMILGSGVANVIGDAVMIGLLSGGDPAKAVRGAAIGTAAGLFVGGAIPFFYFIFKNNSSLRLCKFKFNFGQIGKTCSNGLSEFLSNISTSLVNAVYNGILMAFVGQEGVSAYGAISYVNVLFSAVYMGYCLGVSPIIGYNFGSKNDTELKSIHSKNISILLVMSIIMTFLAETLTNPLSALFSSGNEKLMEITAEGMAIFGLSFMLKGFNTYASSLFTSLNSGIISGVLSIFRSLIFSIGAVLAMPLCFYYIWGEQYLLTGVWWAVNFAEGLAVIMAFIFIAANKKKYRYAD